jgi:cytochrome c peroxidase
MRLLPATGRRPTAPVAMPRSNRRKGDIAMKCLPPHLSGAAMTLACLAVFAFASPFVRAQQPFELTAPLGLKPVRVLPDNPLNREKIELGKQLYFDPRLSRDDTVSCASCHDPNKGWSNGERFATGVRDQKGGRSAPTIINAGYQRFQFWDGRAIEVEGQALGPIQNPIEMDMTLPELESKLNGIAGYRSQFQKVYGTEVTSEGVANAIGAFERTILAGDAPFDRFKAGDESALSESAQRGMKVFFNKASCSACHAGPNFTDGAFHNVGIGMDKPEPDVGRFAESGLEGDRGTFKTPTLREIARTAPYMHDGNLATLEDVIEHYNKGGIPNPQLDEEIFPLKLSDQDKADLITFLKEGLSCDSYPLVEPPELPK